MLKIFAGSDIDKAEKAYIAFCEKFKKENPNSKIILLDSESIEFEALVGECLTSRDLFGAGVFCRGRRILKGLENFAPESLLDSKTIFVFFEPDVKTIDLVSYKKFVECFEIKGYVQKKSTDINLFVISDKFAERNKRALWIEYEKALLRGADSENIYFNLQWQTRAMLAARVSASAEEAGLKQFPYDKSKRAQKKFKEGELEKLSNQLLNAWHAGHGGSQDFELELEQFILSV
ncbi:MAG TPA: hypothetical protein VJI73_01045 [Candidatus Paceibacterota bacterium]